MVRGPFACPHLAVSRSQGGDVNRYKKTRTLSREDAAYIAGLIDGEGTIALSRKHRQDNRQLAISIANTETALLEFVRNATGVGKITRKRIAHPEHTPSMTYVVTNRQALALLSQIAPYLRSYKARRADLVLEHYLRLTPRNGRYSTQQHIERERFIDEFQHIRP